MSGIELGLEGLKLCWSLAALMVVYLFVFRPSQIAAYRQDLFFLRDGLFEYAVAHDLLGTAAHRQLRYLLNGLIRAAPMTNLLLVCIGVLNTRNATQGERGKSITSIIGELSDQEARAFFKSTEEQALGLVMRMMLFGSFSGWLLLAPLVGVVKPLGMVVPPIAQGILWLKHRVASGPAFNRIEFDARRIGLHNELVPTGL